MRDATDAKLLEILEIKAYFQAETKRLRRELGIPAQGFNTSHSYRQWLNSLPQTGYGDWAEASFELAKLAVSLLQKNYPSSYFDESDWTLYLADYLTGNRKAALEIMTRNPSGISIFTPNQLTPSTVEVLKKRFTDGVVIAIRPEVPKEEVLNFLKEKYKAKKGDINIRSLMKDKKAVRIRRPSKTSRDVQIYALWMRYRSKSLRELERITGGKCANKFSAVSRILKNELELSINPDTLKTIISRMDKKVGSNN